MKDWRDFDPANPHAFLSYVRKDDEYLHGGITWLRRALESAVGTLTASQFLIFQDVEHIGLGQTWLKKLDQALEAAPLFIPVLTPRFFASSFCRHEVESFLDYEARADRDDLILPIYLIEAEAFDTPWLRAQDEIATKIRERQFDDWRDLKDTLFDRGPRARVEKVARAIAEASRRQV
ncbi:MAG: toll/interleukin-1 receptor domain-containing protein [Alphaproteobacteria bacterium]